MYPQRGRSGYIAELVMLSAGGAESGATSRSLHPAPAHASRLCALFRLPPLFCPYSLAPLPPSSNSSYPLPHPKPPPLLHPPRHAPYGPPSPAKSRVPRDLPICMPRSAPFRPLCGQKKVAHLSPVRDSADLFLPAGEINPFRRQNGKGALGEVGRGKGFEGKKREN